MDNKKIVVFASGSGTNFINLYNNISNGRVVLLISNNSMCGAIQYAVNNNIDYKIINDIRYPNKKFKDRALQKVLNRHKPDLILLAGYMKKISKNIIQSYKYKIMNIHPSLLPKYGGRGFYGIKVHEAVISSGDFITGVTIHFISENYDEGPIILQEEINVEKDDSALSLSKRVLKKEYKLYLKAVNLFCDNKLSLKNNEVIVNE